MQKERYISMPGPQGMSRCSWRGDSRAQRFVGDGSFPWNPDLRAELAEVHRLGDVVLLRYALSDRFDQGLKESRMHLPAATIRTQVNAAAAVR